MRGGNITPIYGVKAAPLHSSDNESYWMGFVKRFDKYVTVWYGYDNTKTGD